MPNCVHWLDVYLTLTKKIGVIIRCYEEDPLYIKLNKALVKAGYKKTGYWSLESESPDEIMKFVDIINAINQSDANMDMINAGNHSDANKGETKGLLHEIYSSIYRSVFEFASKSKPVLAR